MPRIRKKKLTLSYPTIQMWLLKMLISMDLDTQSDCADLLIGLCVVMSELKGEECNNVLFSLGIHSSIVYLLLCCIKLRIDTLSPLV